jgi:hypothetical protein
MRPQLSSAGMSRNDALVPLRSPSRGKNGKGARDRTGGAGTMGNKSKSMPGLGASGRLGRGGSKRERRTEEDLAMAQEKELKSLAEQLADIEGVRLVSDFIRVHLS